MQWCVESVNQTAAYYQSKGANLLVYRQTNTSDSAFVGFGKTTEDPHHFKLELVKGKARPSVLGNALKYLGLSKLLQYDFTSQSDVTSVLSASGDPSSQQDETDPNGFAVNYVAAAPGDPLARICLHCLDVDDTAAFYTNTLGMEQVAGDEKMVCLRFQSNSTTLVFESIDSALDIGTVFDHLVVGTDDLSTIQSESIFMTPRPMFGATVMGLLDPNGYRIFVMQR